MKARVKRSTGMMGGLAKVSLFVDDKEATKLSNDEEFMIVSNKESVRVKAKQWFLGSKEVEVKENEAIEIRINSFLTLFYLVAFILLFLSGMSVTREPKLIFSVSALVVILIIIFISTRSWFVMLKTSGTNSDRT
ncbi:hypothetical protein SPD48_04495 [Pseudogracilibacillus sp. SE30717A]|uniref:hypothetical protein n=1 Tax=Pseudogracilibacillus sp. SE30717A TaxID=3098293 RepID=UPI00300DF912